MCVHPFVCPFGLSLAALRSDAVANIIGIGESVLREFATVPKVLRRGDARTVSTDADSVIDLPTS
jgi:hypothetical protein